MNAAEIAEANRQAAEAEAAGFLGRVAICDHRWRQVSNEIVNGIYCPRCRTVLDASGMPGDDDVTEVEIPAGQYGGDVDGMLKHFAYGHLPPHLQEVSKDFHDLAHRTAARAPNEIETIFALHALLQAKDSAVRAALAQQGTLT